MALIQTNMQSACLKRPVTFNAIIPIDSMFPVPEAELKPLKTMYLLHGYTGSNVSWLTDSALGEIATLNNLAIIMPNGENHFYVDDMKRLDMYGEYIGRELIDFTRKVFPLSKKREDTIIAGISMGGFGALRNGLKYSETFGHIIAISPALIIDQVASSSVEPNDVGATRGYYESVFDDLDKAAETDMNPRICAEQLKESGKSIPDIYFACGKNDFLVLESRKLRKSFDEMRIPYVYEEGPGSHEPAFFDPHLKRALDRLDLDRLPPMPNMFWREDD